ncbi:MAG: S9 family peptidase [Ktedonobacterales bacterium]
MTTALPVTALAPDDLWDLCLPSEMRLSPDGRMVAVVLEGNDRNANERRAAIWLVDLQGDAPHRFTSGTGRDTSPRWSPDGSQLAFVSTREDGRAQLWVMRTDGGEAQRLTRMTYGVSDPFWSVDGQWIGFRAEVREGHPLQCDKRDAAQQQAEHDSVDQPRLITRLQYRWDGKGYLEGRRQLFRVPVDGGEPEALTSGDFDTSDPAMSPDGHSLAFVCDRDADRDANMTADLWVRDLATGAERRLTDGRCAVSAIAWSPRGEQLAFLAEPQITDHAYRHVGLVVADLSTGATRNLLAETDSSAAPQLIGDLTSPAASPPVWSRDARWIYFLCERGGSVTVQRVPAGGGPVQTVIDGERHIAQFALAPDERRLVALQSSPTTPLDLWVYNLDTLTNGHPTTEPERRLTDLNGGLLARRSLARLERFSVATDDGQRIDAWLARPAKPSTSSPAPLVLWIHGGPHGAYGHSFYTWLHLLTGRGYAVLFANPRGSTGYGESFGQGCDFDWGGGDYRDLMAVVDGAIARGGLDQQRLAVVGKSYGGYMTNWIVGQTDRFKAAVSIYSVTNLLSCFGTGDIDSVWAQGDYGWPWEQEAFYRERSPITYAPRMTTPMRIIGAEEDYRCPISQSEELYVWLKKLGRAPVDFVRLPGASHGTFATPRQRVRYNELILEWLERWVPAEGEARA